MKFNLSKRISLAYIGEGWGECYMRFYHLTYNEARELQPKLELLAKNESESAEFLINFLQEKFIEGKGLSEKNELVDIIKDDLGEFPVQTLIKCVTELLGEPDPKA